MDRQKKKKSVIKEYLVIFLLTALILHSWNFFNFVNERINSKVVKGKVIGFKKLSPIGFFERYLINKTFYYPIITFTALDEALFRSPITFISVIGEDVPMFFQGQIVDVIYQEDNIYKAKLNRTLIDYSVRLIPISLNVLFFYLLVKKKRKRRKRA